MKLHRATAKPDWEIIAVERRNMWQRTASHTGGILTPGNFSSTTGLTFVGLGLILVGQNKLWHGLILIAIGRLCDIVDGVVAERTGTKSPLGEAVDASFDKLAAFASLIVFAAVGIIPWFFALLIGLQNGLTAMLSLTAKSQKRTVHPVSAGKIGGAIEWVALLCFVLVALHIHWLTTVAYTLAVISIVLNGAATTYYVRTMLEQHAQKPQQ
jgi:phosphatidylglycerophosphate synthase